MGASTIEWTDATWNPVTGCAPDFTCWERCYARRMAKRLAGNPSVAHRERYAGFQVHLWPERLDEPKHWKKPRRIFVGSMGDLFHPDVPYDFHLRLWDTFAKCPQHTFILLTKRARRMAAVTREIGGYDPDGRIPLSAEYRDFAENVWLGASCTNQPDLDERAPWLFKCPAAVHYVSLEPLLGPVEGLFCECELCCGGEHRGKCRECAGWGDVDGQSCDACEGGGQCPVCDGEREHGIDWCIVGGETGPGARPMRPDWVRSIRDSCVEAGVPFFFKGWGEWCPVMECTVPDSVLGRTERHVFSDGKVSYRVGKKHSGRRLDGRVWNQFPESTEGGE